MSTDGVDERSAIGSTDVEARARSQGVPAWYTDLVNGWLDSLEHDKETAERALLDAYQNTDQELGVECSLCGCDIPYDWGASNYTDTGERHTPDCIIPGLLERYGETT